MIQNQSLTNKSIYYRLTSISIPYKMMLLTTVGIVVIGVIARSVLISTALEMGTVLDAVNAAIVVLVTTLVGVAVFVSMLAIFFYRPISQLTERTRSILEENRFAEEVPGYAEQNLDRLAKSINEIRSRLQYRMNQLNLASKISNEATVTTDTDAFLQQVTDSIKQELDYHDVRIYTLDTTGKLIRLRAGSGKESEYLLSQQYTEKLSSPSPASKALQSKEILQLPGKLNVPAELLIPFESETPGVMHIIGQHPDSFDSQDIDIYRLIATLVGDMLQNKRLLTTVQEAMSEAEEANRMKSTFLANMSHELRTPLNAILNFTGFVVDGDAGPVNDMQVNFLDKVHDAGKHLLGLINEILDLSKIEAGMMDFLMEEMNVNAMIQGVLDTAEGLTRDKPVRIVPSIQDNLPEMIGDQRRLRQVLLNIISNAVKFTPEGTIDVVAKFNDETKLIEMEVRDSGIGIAPENQPLVFQSFRQIKHDLEVSGTGLGMPISKHFVEEHGGQMWFKSEVGKGTAFFITLPLQPVNERHMIGTN